MYSGDGCQKKEGEGKKKKSTKAEVSKATSEYMTLASYCNNTAFGYACWRRYKNENGYGIMKEQDL